MYNGTTTEDTPLRVFYQPVYPRRSSRPTYQSQYKVKMTNQWYTYRYINEPMAFTMNNKRSK